MGPVPQFTFQCHDRGQFVLAARRVECQHNSNSRYTHGVHRLPQLYPSAPTLTGIYEACVSDGWEFLS